MEAIARELVPINIEDELKQSYLDYAMSVIIGRALPDVRDGLKPVHRRALYAMHVLGNDWNKPYKKSARVVGDVIGKYHPHGESAAYDTIVRMAQPFSLRYMLVDGQGNFGSVDGDPPAAMRYTEVRMSKIAHRMLADLDKETVDFVPNYDGSETIPDVLPTVLPNLLVNGASGIAVGMATNIPPHNLNEVIDACIALSKNPETSITELMEFIPGPDFPTAGIINGRRGIVEAYKTGRGRIYVRARTHIETDERSNKDSIIVTELPYQVNKARLMEKIAELVKSKKIEGITGLRDESDKDGMRMVIECRRDGMSDIILNNLYAHTQLQTVYGINIVALEEGQPRTLNLKQLLEAFLKHRREVVTRRTLFDLRKAREKAHQLEGLGVALANIDDVIQLIKQAKNPQDAKAKLLAKTWPPGIVKSLLERTEGNIAKPDDLPEGVGLIQNEYRLSEVQAQGILDLRLHRLTALEQDKIIQDYENLLTKIQQLLEILANPDVLKKVIQEELLALKESFGDVRRTEITQTQQDLSLADLITETSVVVTLSHLGYAKTQPLSDYQAQHRGGKGKSAAKVKQEDYVSEMVITNSHDTLLCFSSIGKVYWMKAYEIPQASRTATGRPIVNLLPLSENERITAILPVKGFEEERWVFMASERGVVKRVALKDFSRPRSTGIIAVDLGEADKLIGVALTDGNNEVMLFTDAGKVIRFDEGQVRVMGRNARGVRGIKCLCDQKVIALNIVKPDQAILTATENGYGKRTDIEEYRPIGRGGQGVISIQVSDRNGPVVGAVSVAEEDEVMLITDRGTLVRTRVAEISKVGRNTQGVRLINLSEGEKLMAIQGIPAWMMEEAEADVDSEVGAAADDESDNKD